MYNINWNKNSDYIKQISVYISVSSNIGLTCCSNFSLLRRGPRSQRQLLEKLDLSIIITGLITKLSEIKIIEFCRATQFNIKTLFNISKTAR